MTEKIEGVNQMRLPNNSAVAKFMSIKLVDLTERNGMEWNETIPFVYPASAFRAFGLNNLRMMISPPMLSASD